MISGSFWYIKTLLANVIMGVLFEAGLQKKLQDLLGEKGLYGLLDATTYLFYLVPWVFPLLNVLTNPVISKSVKSFQNR